MILNARDRCAESEATKIVTCECNVYSFGVVLLELLTGRQADEDFGHRCHDLVSWVRANLSSLQSYQPQEAELILDARITIDTSLVGHMLSVLRVAMTCVDAMPTKRPLMTQVLETLEKVAAYNHTMLRPLSTGGNRYPP